MFRKIEIWIVGLIIFFFFLFIILISGILRDAYLGKNKTPEILRVTLMKVAEIPKNIYFLSTNLIDRDAPPKLEKHKNKIRYNKFIDNKRNALLVLPRYDHTIKRSVVDIIDLKNFTTIHTYKHDIYEMNKRVTNKKKFPRLEIDNSPIRFPYWHPLIFDDGSLISIYGPAFKIDFCSNLQWINDKEKFHHSQMIDHEGNIWIGGRMDPKSKFVKKYSFDSYIDDSIIKIDEKGNILYHKSITEILIENKIIDINIFDNNWDPIHLNDVEPALNDSKYWNVGDIFISLRHQSSIIHYRPITNKVINYITGPFSQQHDVDIISDKEISIFNNNNFILDNEHSEILIYNFETKKFRKLFEKQLKEDNFKTEAEGLSHIFKDGSLLVEEQGHGRILLYNAQGDKEWEYVNIDKNGDIGHVNWSRVIEDKLFIENFKLLVENKKCLN